MTGPNLGLGIACLLQGFFLTSGQTRLVLLSQFGYFLGYRRDPRLGRDSCQRRDFTDCLTDCLCGTDQAALFFVLFLLRLFSLVRLRSLLWLVCLLCLLCLRCLV